MRCGLLFVLGIAVGCGGGGGTSPTADAAAQLQAFENCTVEGVLRLFHVVGQLERGVRVVSSAAPVRSGLEVKRRSAVRYEVSCEFSMTGVGAPDTRLWAELEFGDDPQSESVVGQTIQVRNVLVVPITSSGTLRCSGALTIAWESGIDRVVTGRLDITNDETRCDISFSVGGAAPLRFAIAAEFRRTSLQAMAFSAEVEGHLSFVSRRAGGNIAGEITLLSGTPDARVRTDHPGLEDLVVTLLPPASALDEMIECLKRGIEAAESVAGFVDDFSAQANGDDRGTVTIVALNELRYDDGACVLSVIFAPGPPLQVPPFEFALESRDGTMQGASTTPIEFSPYMVSGSNVIPGEFSGSMRATVASSSCEIGVDFIGAGVTPASRFAAGEIVLTVTRGGDVLTYRIRPDVEDGIFAIDAALNGLPIPHEFILYLV